MADVNNVVFPRKLTTKFLLLYKELPCLWDRKSLYYKHKKKRNEAVSILTDLVQKYYKSATRVHVLRKIESLRACARREYKKVVKSRSQTTNPEKIHIPQLWYYDIISFLYDDEVTNSVEIKRQEPYLEETDNNDIEDDHVYEECMDSLQHNTARDTQDHAPEESINIQRMRPYTFEEDHNTLNKRQCTEVQDEYDAIGVNVAAKLRTLPSNSRIIAEKLINDVLFQAQMNGLNSSSCISTDPFK